MGPVACWKALNKRRQSTFKSKFGEFVKKHGHAPVVDVGTDGRLVVSEVKVHKKNNKKKYEKKASMRSSPRKAAVEAKINLSRQMAKNLEWDLLKDETEEETNA